MAGGLVDRVAAWARARGANRLVAGVTGGNVRAIRFYEKSGFREIQEALPEAVQHPACATYLSLDLSGGAAGRT